MWSSRYSRFVPTFSNPSSMDATHSYNIDQLFVDVHKFRIVDIQKSKADSQAR